ncbi:MAG: GTP cyclohydrolase, FolE2/MptA family [Deltaproteobacteria bacterium]|nr:GTP cyclohydrolase, FolE2/MptA family [Deltaproteobacteria bacterium]
MKDIQSELDYRRINIKKVGVKTISYPITVLDKARKCQHTVATVNMYVNLPHRFKGTHMSRFVEILNRFHGQIDLGGFHHILEEMKERLEAEAAHVEMGFIYFLPRKQNPESLNTCRYECRMHGSLAQSDDLEFQFTVPVSLPLKEMVVSGLPRSLGHWGHAVVAVRFRHFIWIEDIITLVERAIEQVIGQEQEQNSQDLQGTLSVESLTRHVGVCLAELSALKWFSVTVENLFEGYSTFATTSYSS